MKKITGGVTAAKGFQAAAVAAGIKYKDRDDMALIYSERPCVLAGTFTSNVVKAAPVLFDKKVVEESPYGQAVVINAGIANACTGREGFSYCEQTAKAAAEALSISENAVLVASTGVIGMQLPIDRIVSGIKKLTEGKQGDLEAGTRASRAIMTTDTKNKEAAVQIEIGGRTVTLGGMCKGCLLYTSHRNCCPETGHPERHSVLSSVCAGHLILLFYQGSRVVRSGGSGCRLR